MSVPSDEKVARSRNQHFPIRMRHLLVNILALWLTPCWFYQSVGVGRLPLLSNHLRATEMTEFAYFYRLVLLQIFPEIFELNLVLLEEPSPLVFLK